MSAQVAYNQSEQDEKDVIADRMLKEIVAMQPRLRERAAQCKADRRVPDETVQEL